MISPSGVAGGSESSGALAVVRLPTFGIFVDKGKVGKL
jgi:hypothetical protein